jgi:hypothetical protein
LQNIQACKVCDAAIVDKPFIPELAVEGLVGEIDYYNVLNLNNI